MLASLPMYDWPEHRAATDAFWARLRSGLEALLPEALSRPGDDAALRAHWCDPGLRFSQCCWGPLGQGLDAQLQVLAQPDYGDVPGGRGPYYRSALVARSGAAQPLPQTPGPALPKGVLAGQRLAINGRDSMSGFLALAADLGTDPAEQAAALVETGGHRASVQAVAEGRADLAAIDCRSWAMAQRHEPAASGLVVVGWTGERLGLPYVSARATAPDLVIALRRRLLETGCHAPG